MRLAVLGATGRTGSTVAKLADAADDIERLDWDGRAAIPERAEVVVDFSVPEALMAKLPEISERGLPLVTGTTGLDQDQQAKLREAATRAPVVQSGNMSMGVTLLSVLVEKAAAHLGEDYDIEVAETHHRFKKDSPSGTALLLGEAAAQGRGTSLSSAAVFGRHGRTEARAASEIGFSVRRGGGVPGDHEVAFLSEEEVVGLSHRALGRDVFGRGALRAARWLLGRPPALYGMRDVLDL